VLRPSEKQRAWINRIIVRSMREKPPQQRRRARWGLADDLDLDDEIPF
jgi:hypothetical protein